MLLMAVITPTLAYFAPVDISKSPRKVPIKAAPDKIKPFRIVLKSSFKGSQPDFT
jgi:hypothetical protein